MGWIGEINNIRKAGIISLGLVYIEIEAGGWHQARKKVNRVATLVADLPRCNFTNRQNPPNLAKSPYILN